MNGRDNIEINIKKTWGEIYRKTYRRSMREPLIQSMTDQVGKGEDNEDQKNS